MIDKKGYRANVGIIISNARGQLLWAKRTGQDAWQFPQGGILNNESPEQAMYRELNEEVGLSVKHVEIIANTRDWLYYDLPEHLIRHNSKPLCIGQKQKWYLLEFIGNETDISLNNGQIPEFDYWQWVDYWYPLNEVIAFKRDVYLRALNELAPNIGKAPKT